MILTGKAKEDFISYYNSSIEKTMLKSINFEMLPLSVQNALIIDLFDTKRIYINTHTDFNYVDVKKEECNCDDFCCDEENCYEERIECFTYNIRFYNISIYDIYNDKEFETRQEAITKAIEKANEIYNSNF